MFWDYLWGYVVMITRDDIEAMVDDGELLPCPFCGGQAAEPWFNFADGNERGEVYCTKCNGSMVSSYYGWLSNDCDAKNAINEAITAWNTRAIVQRNNDTL